MSEKNNGWKKPEEKFPETEIEDSFAGFFSEEETLGISEKEKKRRKSKSGPDILAVSEEEDPGFVIKEVVALDTGNEIVNIKEESEEPLEHEEKEESEVEDAQEEENGAQENCEDSKETEDEIIEVDLSAESSVKKRKDPFEKVKKYVKSKRKYHYAATVGAVLVGLALLGTISLCSMLFNFGVRIFDNTSQKEAFEWKIYPLLMLDPAAFENPQQLDDEIFLKSALWSTLLENRTKYAYDENGMLLVPASDLDVAAKSLYGESVTLNHRTFNEGYDYFYIYNEETNTYAVPIMSQTASYVPKVIKISKSGDIYTLIVGYVAPTTLWNVSEDGSSESVPDKYMYYDLEKVARGEYIIRSVRRIPEDELPDDLEVSDMQSLNQTQYFDYDEIQQEYLEQEMAKNDSSESSSNSENSSGTSSSESSSSNSENSSESSSSES